MGRGRRILLYWAVAIAVGGTGAWYLHQGPEPASGLSEGDRVVVNGQYKLRLDSRVTVNEPPASGVAKQDRSS